MTLSGRALYANLHGVEVLIPLLVDDPLRAYVTEPELFLERVLIPLLVDDPLRGNSQ